MKKNIKVYTNDTATPMATLTITGQVDRLYTLSPKRVRLVGVLGSEIKQTLKLATLEKLLINSSGIPILLLYPKSCSMVAQVCCSRLLI